MNITLDLDYEEVVELRERLKRGIDPTGSGLLTAVTEDILEVLNSAIENENERRGQEHAEKMVEFGGYDDSKYRQDMKDAGRGHLLR